MEKEGKAHDVSHKAHTNDFVHIFNENYSWEFWAFGG